MLRVCAAAKIDSRRLFLVVLVAASTLALAACREQPESKAEEIRPVRTVTVEKRHTNIPLVMTGRIESADEAALGFRIAGRMIERTAKVGDQVEAGQLVARLEPQNELNALRSAQANLTAAQAQSTEANNRFERQQTLLSQGWTTRAIYDQAEKARQTTNAQVEAAQAQLQSAHDLVGFTELHADAPGVVTAVGAEPHEVVQAGQMIIRLARHGGRDAVFDVPAQVLRMASSEDKINIRLTDDPSVKATGRVREVSPQADPVTRTFQVRVGITDPPEAMRLGATVTGSADSDADPTIEIPAAGLTKVNNHPAVWIVDPATLTVSLRNVDVARFDPATVTIAQGLDTGDVVVTAGVQALHPGQKVRILGSDL
jgi:RND family efflux transporter MFP subunit